jgi:hypothetical protein
MKYQFICILPLAYFKSFEVPAFLKLVKLQVKGVQNLTGLSPLLTALIMGSNL